MSVRVQQTATSFPTKLRSLVSPLTSAMSLILNVAKDSRTRAGFYVSAVENYLGHEFGSKSHTLALAAVSGLAVTSAVAAKASDIGPSKEEVSSLATRDEVTLTS